MVATLLWKRNGLSHSHLNVKCVSLTGVEENIGNLCNLELGEEFLDVKLEAQSRRERIDKFDFIKIRNLLWKKDALNNEKTSCGLQEKYLQITCLTKNVYPEYI